MNILAQDEGPQVGFDRNRTVTQLCEPLDPWKGTEERDRSPVTWIHTGREVKGLDPSRRDIEQAKRRWDLKKKKPHTQWLAPELCRPEGHSSV